MTQWPKRSNVRAVFGEPGGRDSTAGTCNLAYPMVIAWDPKQRITQFRCHAKVEASFEELFKRTLEHYGLAKVQELGLNLFGGCYNLRPMRGTKSTWSMHSWGIAIDLDPVHNGLKTPFAAARFGKPEYKPFWQIVESVGLWGLGPKENRDAMHVEATSGR